MPGRMEFQLRLPQSAPVPVRRNLDEPPRILIMADFSGRGLREPDAAPNFDSRPLLAVDIDRFDTVMSRLQPQLRLPLATGVDIEISFTQLDDFHPDALYQRLALFQTLRRTRTRLLDPAHFAQAAAELTPLTAPEPVHAAPPVPLESEAALFERLLGREPVAPLATRPAEPKTHAIQTLLQTIVQPHIVHTDPRQATWVTAVDAAIGAAMRTILHQPAFQALEAAWRGAYRLVTSLDDDAAQIFLLDATRQELLADLYAADGQPSATGLHRRLIELGVQMPDGQPWTLLVGDYAFGATPEDVALLGTLGSVAAAAGGPFLATAAPSLLGCDSAAALADPEHWSPLSTTAEQHWRRLQTHAVAPWIGLALPRVLLRLPYGRKTDPVESFAFEEMPSDRDPETYLWGSPALVCAQLIAMAMTNNEGEVNAGHGLELDDCPTHVYEEAGERLIQPATEALLGERAVREILARGLMPLLGYRQRPAVRLARLQSLAGTWRSYTDS